MEQIPAYERDPYLRELEMEVPTGAGEGAEIAVPDTVLFPGGGGQPADAGWLGEVAVTPAGGGPGEHLLRLAGPVPAGPARLRVDWDRRYDLMQQHTAQHLLTALAAERHGWATTAFHLGAEVSDIELAVASLARDEISRLEEEVAAEVRAARPVVARRVAAADLSRLGARSRRLPPNLGAEARLVEITGIDLATCGGTHLASTSEIEAVKLLGTEPMRGGTRLFWVAGARLRARLGRREERAAELRRLFSAGDEEVAAVATGRLAELGAQERLARRLAERLAEAEVARTLAAGGPLLWLELDFTPPGGPAKLAGRLAAAAEEGLAFVVAPQGEGWAFALAAGARAPHDPAALGPGVASRLGGRGGGGRLFQGRAPSVRGLPEVRSGLLAALVDGPNPSP